MSLPQRRFVGRANVGYGAGDGFIVQQRLALPPKKHARDFVALAAATGDIIARGQEHLGDFAPRKVAFEAFARSAESASHGAAGLRRNTHA